MVNKCPYISFVSYSLHDSFVVTPGVALIRCLVACILLGYSLGVDMGVGDHVTWSLVMQGFRSRNSLIGVELLPSCAAFVGYQPC